MVLESDTCRCARWAAPRDVIRGKRRQAADDGVFFDARRLAGGDALGDQKSVGGDARGCVMMKSAPSSALIVTQSEFLLEVLVIALNAPTHMRLGHQVIEGDVLRQRRQVVLEGIGVFGRPFDQQPLLRAQARLAGVTPGMTHPYGGKASTERLVGSLAPANGVKSVGRQPISADGPGCGVASQADAPIRYSASEAVV